MKTIYTKQSINDVVEGLNLAADVVTSTMGAKGKNVIIGQNIPGKELKFTKDGVSVAREIKLENSIQNMGAQILISAANKTVHTCGDGTTLTSLLLQQYVNRASVLLEKGANFNTLFKYLDDDLEFIKEEILNRSKVVKDSKVLNHIATVSSKSKRIGKLFEELYSQTGLDSLVTLERSSYSNKTYFDVVKGIEFGNGFKHTAFMTDKVAEQAVYENPYIHIHNDVVNRLNEEMKDILSYAVQYQQPVVIIAPDFGDAFVRQAVMQKVNEGSPILLIKTPGFGNDRFKNEDDIASFLSEDGTVDKIVCDAYKFILYNEDTPYLEQRINDLKIKAENAIEDYDQKDYQLRIHKLRGSSGVFYVGANTEIALEEEYDRVEDAIGATQSAIRQGYVPGGGLTLYNIAIENKKDIHPLTYQILQEPLYKILSNSNVPEFDKTKLTSTVGYNVLTNEYEDFYETGILDPTMVLLTALDNAVTNAKLVLNTSFVLFNKSEKTI
jgi:chaperonin GroEL